MGGCDAAYESSGKGAGRRYEGGHGRVRWRQGRGWERGFATGESGDERTRADTAVATGRDGPGRGVTGGSACGTGRLGDKARPGPRVRLRPNHSTTRPRAAGFSRSTFFGRGRDARSSWLETGLCRAGGRTRIRARGRHVARGVGRRAGHRHGLRPDRQRAGRPSRRGQSTGRCSRGCSVAAWSSWAWARPTTRGSGPRGAASPLALACSPRALACWPRAPAGQASVAVAASPIPFPIAAPVAFPPTPPFAESLAAA